MSASLGPTSGDIGATEFRGVDPGAAIGFFVVGWVTAQILALVVVAVVDPDGDATTRSIGVLGLLFVVAWSVQLIAVQQASSRVGSGSVVNDFSLRVRPIDAIGLLIGALTQVVVVPALYVPLRAVWPDTFARERLEETARELVDRADGASMALLVALVVLGAPIVEEIVYRGLLQRPRLDVATSRAGQVGVVVIVAAAFAGLHFRPVEFLGLFAFGVVAGACAAATGRIGMAIAAHIGFNAVGVLLVA